MHLHVFVLKSILSFSYFLGYINRHLHSTRAIYIGIRLIPIGMTFWFNVSNGNEERINKQYRSISKVVIEQRILSP